MYKVKYALKRIFPFILVLTISLCSVFTIQSSAQTLKEDINPTFKELILDGVSPEGTYYEPEAEFYQDPQAGEYSINTNADVLWWQEDGAALLYNKYSMDYGDLSTLTVETTVTSLESTGSASAIHESASAGVIIRQNEDNDSPYIFLHVRRDYIWIVYRTDAGVDCNATTNRIENPEYPIKLKMVKSGNAVACYAQNGRQKNYTRIASVNLKMDPVVLAGVAVHSCTKNNTVKGTFDQVKITVEGPDGDDYVYNEPGKSEDDSSEEEDISNTPYPDAPAGDTVLLRETFTDGSMINKPESTTNPVWGDENSDAALANLVYETDKEGKTNVSWRRNFSSGYMTIGKKSWTDYSLSVDMKFGENTNLDLRNQVDFYVRYHPVDMYGNFYYKVSLEQNKYIRIYKMFITYNQQIAQFTLPDGYVSEDWVTWTIDAFDNTITVYRTETDTATGEQKTVKKLSVTDNKIGTLEVPRPYVISAGKVGIGSQEADVYLDNITVRKLEDLYGGSYDNKICGNWNEAVPEYLDDWKVGK